MKARPRSVEREVADALSLFYARLGLNPVARIPVLGRTGPDLEINVARLVVDVKSRLEVPKSILAPKGKVIQAGDLLGARISEPELLFAPELYPDARPSTDTVWKYWLHMDEWRQENLPFGVSVLALHRPGMHISSVTLVIHLLDWRRFYDNCTTNRAGDC